MKIYTITLALLCYAGALTVFGGLFGVTLVESYTSSDISALLPQALSYTDSDIGMYIYGDFLKMLASMAKLFAFAPSIAAQSLTVIGVPAPIVSVVMTGLYVTYVTGIVQILGKFAIQGAE